MTSGAEPPAPQQVTARQLIAAAAARFRAARLHFGHGTTNADDEAAWLMVHALGCSHEALARHFDHPLSRRVQVRAKRLFDRRIAERTPAAYLTHEAWLGDHRFYVDPRVIVPRSYIAELLRERLQPWVSPRRPPRAILDLCTGSGCLAIVAAHTFPRAHVDGVDLSAAALTIARRNVREHRLTQRVALCRSDLFGSLRGKRYDLILANPPYVRERAMQTLPAEYRHEPTLALRGGDDGLALVRHILRDAPAHLHPQGWLVLEVGHNRARVERAFPTLPFIWAETSGGDDCVALLPKAAWSAARPSPAPPTRPASARHRSTRVR